MAKKPIFPSPPPKKKNDKPIFGDVEKRQRVIKFRQDLRDALFKLRTSLPAKNAVLAETIVRFVGHIAGPQDVTTLPYVSEDGKARVGYSSLCVAAIISHTIIKGWKFQNDEIEKEEAYKGIEQINAIAENGLDKYRVSGNEKGYYLEATA